MYYFAQIYSVCIPLSGFFLCLRRKQPKMLRFTASCDLFISFSQTCVESGQHFPSRKGKAKLKHALVTGCTTTLFSTGACVFRHWDACSSMITQLGNKQCLPWQKPLSLAGGHKASAVHLFKITPHSSFIIIPDTWQKWQACVCVCVFQKEWQSVILCQVLFEQKTQRWAAGVRTHWTWRSAWSLEKEELSQAFIPDFAQTHAL